MSSEMAFITLCSKENGFELLSLSVHLPTVGITGKCVVPGPSLSVTLPPGLLVANAGLVLTLAEGDLELLTPPLSPTPKLGDYQHAAACPPYS